MAARFQLSLSRWSDSSITRDSAGDSSHQPGGRTPQFCVKAGLTSVVAKGLCVRVPSVGLWVNTTRWPTSRNLLQNSHRGLHKVFRARDLGGRLLAGEMRFRRGLSGGEGALFLRFGPAHRATHRQDVTQCELFRVHINSIQHRQAEKWSIVLFVGFSCTKTGRCLGSVRAGPKVRAAAERIVSFGPISSTEKM